MPSNYNNKDGNNLYLKCGLLAIVAYLADKLILFAEQKYKERNSEGV